jgi:hypothetical protein
MFPKLARIAAAVLITVSGGLLTASPASAVSTRDLKSVRYNTCIYAA